MKKKEKKTIEDLHKILTDNGANITQVNEWGIRELAYEIKNQQKGYYVVTNLESESAVCINEFNRLAKINANVLRHMIIKLN